MTDDLLIRMRDVRKNYAAKSSTVHALDGLNLEVAEGTVRGLLGPNGAGKTTTVKVLTTLTRPTSGEVTIDGLDVVRHGHEVRNRIGVSGQNATIDEELTARENLMLVGRLFHLGDKGAKSVPMSCSKFLIWSTPQTARSRAFLVVCAGALI